RPQAPGGSGEFPRSRVAAPTDSVRSDEIGIAPLRAGSLTATSVSTPTRPKVASREADEDGRPTGVRPLPLQRQEHLFHRVTHARAPQATARYGAGSRSPTSANPRSRSWQASQSPQPIPSAPGS